MGWMHYPERTIEEILKGKSAELCVCGKRANHDTSDEVWSPKYGD